MIDDNKIFAWIDGELDPAEAAKVEAKVDSDANLQRLVARHRALGDQLRGAFGPIAAEEVPERLRAAVRPKSDVVEFRPARQGRILPTLPQWAAMAATLALGVFVGNVLPRAENGAPVAAQNGTLYAASVLDQALSTQLASAPAGDVRIGLTFRDHAGTICRSFTTPQSTGLACRDAHGWQLRGLFAPPEGQSDDYRMAAGMDPNLAALLDSSMADEPFDAAAEKQARARAWK